MKDSLTTHFPFAPEELKKALDLALSQGGEFAEIFLEYKEFNSIHMEEDIIKETSENISLGAGIRVICGDKTGYGYTNDLSFDRLNRAALTAASIAKKSPSPFQASPVHSSRFSHNYYPVERSAQKEPLAKKIALVKDTYRSALDFDGKIKKAKVSFIDLIRHITIVNSEGQSLSDVQPLIKLTCLCIAEKPGKREMGYSGGGGKVGMEYFQSKKPEDIGQEAAEEALNLLEAREPPAGEMPIVLAPGHSGVLIHEAVGHLLEADFIRKKTSIFWDKAGKKVGSDQIFIYDDPTIPFFRGSYNIDDEGTIPEKTALIEQGKLVGFLQDRLSARSMGLQPTGHGRRQDYSCIPIPRMSNTYIDRGEYDREEILKSVNFGFYAQNFQGGQVEDSGKFTFSVSSGFLIECGKLTAPVKQATLIGTNIDILNKIEKVGSDLAFGLPTGTCGKEGQAAPVTDGCPTIKVTKMTVGGLK